MKNKLDERSQVATFVGILRRMGFVVFVDTDSKARVFRSPWDFVAAINGRVIFVEAKRMAVKPARDAAAAIKPKLRSYQLLALAECTLAGCHYGILVFYDDGSDAELLVFYDPLRSRHFTALNYFQLMLKGPVK